MGLGKCWRDGKSVQQYVQTPPNSTDDLWDRMKEAAEAVMNNDGART